MKPKIDTWSFLMSHQNNYKYLTNLRPDDRRLQMRSNDRYAMFYYAAGCPRYNGSDYRTQADLDREREAAEALIPKVIVEIKGNLKWTQEEALQYLEEKSKVKSKPEPEKSKARPEWKEKTIDEIYYATMAKAGGELPKPKPAEEARFYEGRWESLAERRDRAAKERLRKQEEERQAQQYRKIIARRARQKAAMDSGAGFSTPQQPCSAGVITWIDPLITDVRLVRLVLGADRGSREMTAEEEADYWYWKARGK